MIKKVIGGLYYYNEAEAYPHIERDFFEAYFIVLADHSNYFDIYWLSGRYARSTDLVYYRSMIGEHSKLISDTDP